MLLKWPNLNVLMNLNIKDKVLGVMESKNGLQYLLRN